jgi:hypothetical protein
MSRRWPCLIAVGACATLACGGTPYGEDRRPSEGGATGAAEAQPQTSTQSPTQAAAVPGATNDVSHPGGTTAPASEDVVLFEDFEGTPKFSAAKGTLTQVASPTGGRAGRLCLDATGNGAIERKMGPSPAGTYVFSALVRADPDAPAATWSLESTHFAPAPNHAKNDGELSATAKTVSLTKVVASSAFTAHYVVLLGGAPGSCMLVDDIRVLHTP